MEPARGPRRVREFTSVDFLSTQGWVRSFQQPGLCVSLKRINEKVLLKAVGSTLVCVFCVCVCFLFWQITATSPAAVWLANHWAP